MHALQIWIWNLKEKDHWNVGSFWRCLHRLTDKDIPNLQCEACKELALSWYLDQLDQPDMFRCETVSLKNLFEAVSSTIELELYLPREQSVRTVNETASEPATTSKFQKQVVSDSSLLQQLLDRIEKLGDVRTTIEAVAKSTAEATSTTRY